MDDKTTLMNADNGDDGEIIFTTTHRPRDEETDRFDQYIDALQTFVCSEEFGQAQDAFLSEHCGIFDASEENKLEYMPIFQQWTALIEKLLESALSVVPDCDLGEFMQLTTARSDEVDEQILELLTSLGDFLVFKEMIVAHKQGVMVGNAMMGTVSVRPLETVGSSNSNSNNTNNNPNNSTKKEDDDDERYD